MIYDVVALPADCAGQSDQTRRWPATTLALRIVAVDRRKELQTEGLQRFGTDQMRAWAAESGWAMEFDKPGPAHGRQR